MRADQNRQYVIIDTTDTWLTALDHATYLLQQTHPEMTDEQLLEQILITGITHTLESADRRHSIEIDDLPKTETSQ